MKASGIIAPRLTLWAREIHSFASHHMTRGSRHGLGPTTPHGSTAHYTTVQLTKRLCSSPNGSIPRLETYSHLQLCFGFFHRTLLLPVALTEVSTTPRVSISAVHDLESNPGNPRPSLPQAPRAMASSHPFEQVVSDEVYFVHIPSCQLLDYLIGESACLHVPFADLV